MAVVTAAITSSAPGLSFTEARRRLAQFGTNEIRREEAVSPLFLLVRQFASPVIGLLLGANNFQTYLLEGAMKVLTEDGSVHLERVSDGRYRLHYDGLDFQVVDRWNADAVRSVKTLSGGETFLTSLALALALAERLADLGAGAYGHEALESLFIDEGFGALDTDETLDQVIQALEALQTQTKHRVLGVVTHLTQLADRMPAHTNNYEFAPMDLDGDGLLDLVTINDGTPSANGLRERIFRNQGGTFADVTEEWWPHESNLGWDDNVVVALDVESDGDVDFLIGSLDGPDRLLINDGSGRLSVATDVFLGETSRGTLGVAVADLNGDGRPDVVESQGEVPGHETERVYLGTSVIAPDTAPPVVHAAVIGTIVAARIHDNRAPNMPHDWQSLVARWEGGEAPMTWYGENLFRAALPSSVTAAEVCATDAAGNSTCSAAGG